MKLTLSDVTIERGGRRLFAPLSFSAQAGTLVRIAGANGAGKTTLLRAVAGLTSMTQGSIDWHISEGFDYIGARSVFIGHANGLNEALTPLENIAFSLGVGGFSTSQNEVRDALAAFGVASLVDRRVGTLSQGQRKRVALAQLLLPSNRRATWLLDEPFVALDADTQALLAKHIGDALARGVLVLLTSHQAVEIAASVTQEISL